jgi:hypothetical protein
MLRPYQFPRLAAVEFNGKTTACRHAARLDSLEPTGDKLGVVTVSRNQSRLHLDVGYVCYLACYSPEANLVHNWREGIAAT